ncbi:hypothetical protein QBC39DRAFT_413250 [Podospora conica]|nr:hypothetical protein QBC39DRAFT_413250 [Schizothecium conicum]
MDATLPPPGMGPPPPDVSRASLLIITSSVLHCISLPIVATRIWSRTKPNPHLWWDDWTILISVAFDTINWVLVLIACAHGFARPTPYSAPDDATIARLCQYFAQHAAGWALGFGKVSIALMLFRLRRDRPLWRYFLWGMMGLAIVIAVTCSATLFAVCKPVRAMWDFSLFPDRAKCQAFADINTGILAVAGMTVGTDFILALLPMGFIFQLQRSMRERVTVAFVMALGIVASVASVCKIVSVLTDELTGDGLVDGVTVTFWGILEIQLGIIAACIPCLKRLAELWLRRIGLITSQKTAPTGGNYYMDENSARRTKRNNGLGGQSIQRRDETVVEFDEMPVLKASAPNGRVSPSSDDRRHEAWSVMDNKA